MVINGCIALIKQPQVSHSILQALSYHIFTTVLRIYPDLVPPICTHIESCAWAKGYFSWLGIVRLRDGERPSEDQVGGKARMGMGWVVSVPKTMRLLELFRCENKM